MVLIQLDIQPQPQQLQQQHHTTTTTTAAATAATATTTTTTITAATITTTITTSYSNYGTNTITHKATTTTTTTAATAATAATTTTTTTKVTLSQQLQMHFTKFTLKLLHSSCTVLIYLHIPRPSPKQEIQGLFQNFQGPRSFSSLNSKTSKERNSLTHKLSVKSFEVML